MLAQLLDTGRYAVGCYRLSHWLQASWGPPGRWLAYALYRLNLTLTGADIPPTVKAGRQFTLPHPVGVVIGGAVVLGDEVKLMSGVVLGSKVAGGSVPDNRHPTIGSRVVIGANSVVLGPVVIGDDVLISAGAVVTESVPAGALVRAAPSAIEPRLPAPQKPVRPSVSVSSP